MGLDMYLNKRRYFGLNYDHNTVKNKKTEIIINGEKVSSKNLISINYNVAQWRKANAIHKFFVDNVQGGEDDCKEYYVQKSVMEELRDICKKVIELAVVKTGAIINGYTYENGVETPNIEIGEYIENDEEIAKLLPTQEGFFFGSTDYDKWYLQDIKYTLSILEEELSKKEQVEYYYDSSW